MKKTIKLVALFLFLALGLKAQSYSPIAVRDFGTDSLTQLNKQMWVKAVNIDASMHQITVRYDMVLLSNSQYVTTFNSGSYVRDNNTAEQNFTLLKESHIGQGITNLINQDLMKIQSEKTIESDLMQK